MAEAASGRPPLGGHFVPGLRTNWATAGIVLDREETVVHQPGIDRADLRLSEEVVLQQVVANIIITIEEIVTIYLTYVTLPYYPNMLKILDTAFQYNFLFLLFWNYKLIFCFNSIG